MYAKLEVQLALQQHFQSMQVNAFQGKTGRQVILPTLNPDRDSYSQGECQCAH